MQEAETIGGRVGVTFDGGVAEVRLDRPEKLNALDPAMFEALIEAGERLGRRKDLRAVVLHGAGRGFSAGLDMQIFASMALGRRDGLLADLTKRTHGAAIRLRDFDPFDRLRPIGSLKRLSPNVWPVLTQVILGGVDSHSIDAGLPLLLRTRFHALSRFTRSHTSSLNCSAKAGLSGAGFAINGSASSAAAPNHPPSECRPDATAGRHSGRT